MAEDTKSPAAVPVVVTPIPAAQSRTLRLAWLTTICTAVIGMAPDLIEIVLYLLTSDQTFAKTIEDWFPRSLRYPAMAIIIGLAQKHRSLRRDTNAPIIGTDAAKLPVAVPAEEKE